MKIKTSSELILEAAGIHARKYGCLMTVLEYDDSKIKGIFDAEDYHVGEGGYVPDHHVTNLYGLHEEVSPEEVLEFAQTRNEFNKPIALNQVSLFRNEKEGFDVIKFDVLDSEFYKLNKLLRMNFPNTNKYPVYHAHATIAYMVYGRAAGYLDQLRGLNIRAKIIGFKYSKPDGSKPLEAPIRKED